MESPLVDYFAGGLQVVDVLVVAVIVNHDEVVNIPLPLLQLQCIHGFRLQCHLLSGVLLVDYLKLVWP